MHMARISEANPADISTKLARGEKQASHHGNYENCQTYQFSDH